VLSRATSKKFLYYFMLLNIFFSPSCNHLYSNLVITYKLSHPSRSAHAPPCTESDHVNTITRNQFVSIPYAYTKKHVFDKTALAATG